MQIEQYKDAVEQDFELTFDVDLLEKAGETEGKWLIKGVASVEAPDLDEEVIVIKGMDISYLESHGIINWNHQKGPNAIIGEITKAVKLIEKSPAELYVEGELHKDQPLAQDTYKLMKALQKSGKDKRMKMSVEGKATLREGKKILKSKMTGVALTMQPINPASYAMLAKGMCKHPEAESCMSCDVACIVKALETGYAIDNQTGGDALRTQSLEGACTCKKGSGCKGTCGKVKKGLTKTEIRQVVAQRFSCSDETAGRVLKILQIQ